MYIQGQGKGLGDSLGQIQDIPLQAGKTDKISTFVMDDFVDHYPERRT